ncbi:MAG: hypothetical protein CL398_04220 [Acidiferrobacteraceae bacterium]|nr:hypothetical protein [Acidiferrobacteraceae bacterium]
MINPESIVNLRRYPITDFLSPLSQSIREECRKQFLVNGLCALPQFISPDIQNDLTAEVNSLINEAYFCDSTHNVYLTNPSSSEKQDKLSFHQEQTFVGSVAYDRIDRGGLLETLYLWDPLKDFLGFILGKSPLFRFADPLGACSINVFVEGGQHGWHFDESEFSITLMLQKPRLGGQFEYIPMIRGLADEKEIIKRALQGDRRDVKTLVFDPGTLLVFAGQKTIHRVTEVGGTIPRLVPVLCYADRPDLVNSEAVRTLFWGRST